MRYHQFFLRSFLLYVHVPRPSPAGGLNKWQDGMRNGTGAYFFQDGSRYEGGFKEDKRHGEGTLILAGGGR